MTLVTAQNLPPLHTDTCEEGQIMTYDLSTTWTIVLVAALVWELFWKGLALWRAAKLDQRDWFILLLVIGSVGLLPIVYLLSHHEYRHHRTVGQGLL